jgi:hypothetical protein
MLNLRDIASNLEPGPEGYWISRNISDISYPDHGNDLCFSVEDSSFWFKHRNDCILAALKSFPPPGPVFDIGGGNGFVAQAIQRSGMDVVLMEPGLAGVRNALRRGIVHVVRSTLDDAGARPGTLAAAGLFDVVEHIAEAAAFLKRIRTLLVPDRRIYITVPAYQWLWSREDVVAGHARRYTVPTLSAVLKTAGFSVEFATYFFGFLPVPILLRRALPYRLGAGGSKFDADSIRSDHEPPPAARRIIRILTDRELSRIRRLKPIRMGASVLAVARVPDQRGS